MTIETTIFDFKINRTFQEWAAIFDSEENKKMLKATGITPLYRGVSQEDGSRVVVILQAEEGVALKVWNDPQVKVMIETSGHIYNQTTITQWLWGSHYPS